MIDPFTLAQTHPSLETHTPVQTHTMLEKTPNGKNFGFVLNSQHVLVNKDFAAKNPVAARLFETMQLPVGDINAQNLRMRNGEDKPADIARHVDGWIKAHQKTFDAWIETAKAAK